MRVKEIEMAIMNLPAAEVGALATWLDKYYASLWEQEIEADINSDRLDSLLAEIDEEDAISELSTQNPHRQATLAAIQSGKYASVLSNGDSLPSDLFAASKTKEKAIEERRWVQ